jgi:hypothetical protein
VGPAVGLPDTEVFAEYRAVRGSATRAFVDYTARLKAAGFQAGDPNATEAVEAPQFFYKDDETLVFLIIEEAELEDGALVQLSGPVPPERLLVILAYVPG